MPEIKKIATVPWQTAEEWNQVFASIKRVERRNGDNLENICAMAAGIRRRYEEISGAVDTLCSKTCVECGDICCKRATLWFDLKDLLYLYFGLNFFPETQLFKKTMGSREKTCCHFSKTGCTIERSLRPFVCTWYFCPAQTAYFLQHDPKKKRAIDQCLLEIKGLRNKMEEEFIRISNSKL